MSKFIVGIIVGILIGWGLTSSRKVPSSQSSEIVSADVQEKPISRPRMQIAESHKAVKLEVREKITSSPGAKVEVPEKKIADINITDEEVAQMEQHLPELQNEVSLFKEERGWKVRYQVKENTFAHTGFQDNDLIRYDQIEMLRQDPLNSELMARFENVIHSLER